MRSTSRRGNRDISAARLSYTVTPALPTHLAGAHARMISIYVESIIMSQSSIGSGTANDSNENHPTDNSPSKTMGAESGGSGTAPAPAVAPSDTPLRFDGSMAGADAAEGTEDSLSPGVALQSVPSEGVPVNPDDFPDGPNIEARPWEKDAAKGNFDNAT